MKRFISMVCGLLIAVSMMAHTEEKMSVDKFFNTYAGTNGTESAMLNQSTLKALSERDGISRKAAKLLKSLEWIRVISTSADNGDFIDDAQMTVNSRKDYEIVSSSNKNGSRITFYMSESSPKSLILISVNDSKISYMEIRGEFSLLDFGSLSEIGIR